MEGESTTHGETKVSCLPERPSKTFGEITHLADALRNDVVDVKHLRHTAYIVYHNMQARPTHAEAFLDKMQQKWRRVVAKAKKAEFDRAECTDADVDAVLNLLEADFHTTCVGDTWIAATIVSLDPLTYKAQREFIQAGERNGYSSFEDFQLDFWDTYNKASSSSSSASKSPKDGKAAKESKEGESGKKHSQNQAQKPEWALRAILRFHLRPIYRILPDIPSEWKKDSVLITQWSECLMMERGSSFGIYHYMTLGEYAEMRHKQRQQRKASATRGNGGGGKAAAAAAASVGDAAGMSHYGMDMAMAAMANLNMSHMPHVHPQYAHIPVMFACQNSVGPMMGYGMGYPPNAVPFVPNMATMGADMQTSPDAAMQMEEGM